MISFKLFFEQFVLKEAISLKQAKKRNLSRKYSGAYNNKTNEIFDGKDRLIFPITIEHALTSFHPILKTIREYLHSKGFDQIDTEEYLSGIIKKGKQQFKIGRILQKAKDELIYDFDAANTITGEKLLELYKTDPLRSSKSKEYYVVISRHPYDVAGASTDRNWTSCMDLGTPRVVYKGKKQNEGMNRRYIAQDISEGTLVAYVVPKNELMSNGKIQLRRPISRILIKPHKTDSDSVYSIGKMYGNSYPEFKDMVKEWIDKTLNVKSKGQQAYFNPKLYRDASEDEPVGFMFKKGDELANKVLTDLLDIYNEKELGNQITWETTNNGQEIGYDIKMVFIFPEDIVKPFDELERLYKREVSQIHSLIERRLASTFFEEFKIDNLQPRISMSSLGDGIEVEIDFMVSIGNEEDKYMDDDIMWDLLHYPMEKLKNFEYKRLKQRLYKIVSEYDWTQDEMDKTTAFNLAITQYKKGLESLLPVYKSLDYIREMAPFSPEDVLELDDTQVDNMLKVLHKTVNILTVLNDNTSQFKSMSPYKVTSSSEYIDKIHEIFYNLVKDNLGVDLVDYRNAMKNNWNYKELIKLRPRVVDNQWKNIQDVQHQVNRIEQYIQYLIGYTGEIKI